MQIILLTTVFYLHLSHSSPLIAENNNSLPTCTSDQNYLRSNNSCVSKNTAKSRPFCKIVHRYEFCWFKWIYTNRITKCLPFTTKFMRCTRWVYPKDDFIDEKTSIYIKNEKRTYAMDEFELRGPKNDQEAIVCAREPSAQEIQAVDLPAYIFSAAWITSIISLAVAFVLCVAVPVLTSYRAIMPCYVASLIGAYAILLVRGLGSSIAASNSLFCYVCGLGLHFSFLATFFWLNVIAFDFWRTVRKPVRFSGRFRLLAYMLYAWGCPLVFVLGAVLVDKNKSLGIPVEYRPRFELDCWFHQAQSQLAFFYGPVSLILVINLIFWVLALVSVRKTVGSSWSLLGHSFELASVMGLCWIMEVVSWAVGGDVRYWYASDVFNALQGFCVLIVVLRRPKVRSWLKKSFGCEKSGGADEQSTSSNLEV